jgi:uncharacterized protein YggE
LKQLFIHFYHFMTTENNQEHMCGGGAGSCTGHFLKRKAAVGFILLAVSGSMLLLAMAATAMKEYKYIGRDVNAETTITVSGDGEAFAAPDIAMVSFSITQEAKTPADARKLVDEKMKKISDFLATAGVAGKDIKTTGYNLNPKYEWQQRQILCITYPCPQPPGKQVLLGYEVTQSTEVKVRNLDNAGNVLGGLTDNGATDVSGLTFAVENEDAVKATVREQAIAKAKVKAAQLAKDLDVSLVRIVSFNEGGNAPLYYAREVMSMKALSADAGAPSAPTVSAGENKYTSNVTIVYEIR